MSNADEVRSPNDPRLTRRQLIEAMLASGGVLAAGPLLAACGGGTQATPTPPSGQAPAASAPPASASSPSPSPTACATCPSPGASPGVTPTAGEKQAEEVPPQQPQRGGTIPTPREQTVVVDQAPFTIFDSFNPFIPNGWQYNGGAQQILVENLFYWLPTGEIKPWLGKEWKYNSDYSELTLTLNPKVKWNDGQPFTSEDVKYSLEIQQDPALFGSGIKEFDSVETPDEHTVVIKLTKPNPRYHQRFICGIIGSFIVVPKHIWFKHNPKTFKNNPPVFTGPYVLDRAIPSQLMFVWKKNPNYWNKDEFDPAPQYVVYRTAPVPDSEVQEFKRGTVDVASFDYTHAMAVKNGGYQNIIITTKFRDPCPRGIHVNCDPSKPLLSDPRARWAISYLIDRQKIGTAVWFVPTPPAQYPWADYESNKKWSNDSIASKYQLTYDPKKAEQLFDELGAKKDSSGRRMYKGKQVEINIITPVAVGQPEYVIGQLLSQELQKIGIKSSVRALSGSVFSDKQSKGQYDLLSLWICGELFDPAQFYSQFDNRQYKPIGKDASSDQVRLKDQKFQELILKLNNANPDDPKNKPLYDQALERFYQLLPVIPIIQTTYPKVYNTTYWTGWPTDDNVYTVPLEWWGQFMFVIGNLKPAKSS
ncbi:extracellular solute-binding protein family 5 [Thermobaculum terrenum ATCC BAA-798]|uniref:Extracellular solute-binding protein family 5 n=1 Tax=Thermobaculum terrenum (strain ATCC BAA-798 / CCMEE 7001 / YNP1) TaxID=525904 RepID=D1CIR5_THET1|nr:ABC transporter substrate-binding protein [Thermobaculum terrenum]ACZ43635.1 extracellular solute-binding protein family 5 [Thermobaculum terrenum ATCC BAA-798]